MLTFFSIQGRLYPASRSTLCIHRSDWLDSTLSSVLMVGLRLYTIELIIRSPIYKCYKPRILEHYNYTFISSTRSISISQVIMKSLQISALLAGLSVLVSAENIPKAPQIFAHPKGPNNFQPGRPNRPHGRVCKVTPDVTDAGPAILAAAHKCNHGGTVFLPSGDFVIATALDLTFLDDVDFAIWGNITFKQDIDLWPTQAFQYTYQSASMFWRFGGKNVNIYGDGKGVIDGKFLIIWPSCTPILIYRAEGAGQFWWSAMAKNSSVMRPCLLGTDGLHHATISGLKMLNPPGWFNLISNSTDVLVSDMTMLVGSQLSGAPAKVTSSPRSNVQFETTLLIM